jgi:hypothetical protein
MCVYKNREAKPACLESFSKPVFQVVATFEEVGTDKTKIVFRQIFNSANECRKVKAFAVKKTKKTLTGWKWNCQE